MKRNRSKRLTVSRCAIALLLVCWAGQIRAQVPELLYLRFNAGFGNSVNDKALPGVPGTSVVLDPGVGWDSASPALGLSSLETFNVVGTIGADIGRSGSTFTHNGDWTIELWLKKSISAITQPSGPLIGKAGATSIVLDHQVGLKASTLVLTGPGMNDVHIRRVAYQDSWRHLTIVHDSNEQIITVLVNGNVRNVVPQPAPIPLTGDGASGFLIGGAINTEFEGVIDELRVWSRVLSKAEILNGMGQQVNAQTDDVGVVEIMSPARLPSVVSGSFFTSTEAVSCRISNLGLNTLPAGTVIPLSVSLDSGPALLTESLVLTAPLNTGESTPFTFTATVDLSGGTERILKVTATFAGDLEALNDTRVRQLNPSYSSEIRNFPYVQDFRFATESDTPPAGWRHSPAAASINWRFTSTPGPLSLGVGSDHTTGMPGVGITAYVQGVAAGPPRELDTPVFHFPVGSGPRLFFWINSQIVFGGPPNMLFIDVVMEPSGVVVSGVGGPWTNVGFGWQEHTVDLGAYAGQSARLRFRVTNTLAPAINFLIDDIRVHASPAGMGQSPQPGLAVMDLNNSVSLSGVGIASLENGPYNASVSVGNDLTFSFFGQPNQPIIVVLGPLNTAAATFPGIGAMDIGGPVDPISGIPTGISVLFDGGSPGGLNPFFLTNNIGESQVILPMPVTPPGILTTFQAAILNSVAGVSLSNAIQLEVM